MNQKRVKDFLHEDLTYKIRGCVFRVYNSLGFGHKESVYQKALEVEFKKERLNFEKEKSLNIIYDDKKVGIYRPDFVVENKIIVELKAVEALPKSYESQLGYYLRGTGYQLGFLINFGGCKLDIRRRIWTPNYRRRSSV